LGSHEGGRFGPLGQAGELRRGYGERFHWPTGGCLELAPAGAKEGAPGGSSSNTGLQDPRSGGGADHSTGGSSVRRRETGRLWTKGGGTIREAAKLTRVPSEEGMAMAEPEPTHAGPGRILSIGPVSNTIDGQNWGPFPVTGRVLDYHC